MKVSFLKKGLAIFFVALSSVVFFSGCMTTRREPVQGASKERYMLGIYSAEFPCDLRMLDKAVRETCSKARLIEINRENKMNACEYLYKDINNIRVHIVLNELKDGSVKIKIKVGATGDKESSQVLLKGIDDNLRAQGGNM